MNTHHIKMLFSIYKVMLLLILLPLIIGCERNNSAAVTITNNGNVTIRASVEGDYKTISAGSSSEWAIDWNSGSFSSATTGANLYAEVSSNHLYNKSKDVSLDDGDHAYWTIGWFGY